MSKKPNFGEIEAAVKKLLKEAASFDERKQAIDMAMKLEALKIKAKGNEYGKGFDQMGDEDDGP